jgi:hypothetical protein
MTNRGGKKMKKNTLFFVLVITLVFIAALVPTLTIAWQYVGSPIRIAIPPDKAYTREFDLLVNGRIRLDYTIQNGGSTNIYIFTQEQSIRASAGQEPMEPGRDFIIKNTGVIGSGSVISPRLDRGRYCVAVKNVGDASTMLEGTISVEEM